MSWAQALPALWRGRWVRGSVQADPRAGRDCSTEHPRADRPSSQREGGHLSPMARYRPTSSAGPGLSQAFRCSGLMLTKVGPPPNRGGPPHVHACWACAQRLFLSSRGGRPTKNRPLASLLKHVSTRNKQRGLVAGVIIIAFAQPRSRYKRQNDSARNSCCAPSKWRTDETARTSSPVSGPPHRRAVVEWLPGGTTIIPSTCRLGSLGETIAADGHDRTDGG